MVCGLRSWHTISESRRRWRRRSCRRDCCNRSSSPRPTKYRFDRAHLDAFLDALFAGAEIVSVAPDGSATAVAAAKHLNLKLTTVLGAVLDERLTRRGKLQGEPGAAALLLEMAEVRDVFQPDQETCDYAPYRAVDRLHTTDRVVAALMRDRPGGSILPTRVVKNCRSDRAKVSPYEALEAFDRTCVGLTNLSREINIAAPILMQRLGEPWFAHDFDNVEYDEPEFDRQFGAPGLHAIKRKVRFKPRQTVLPPDLAQKVAPIAFWRDQAGLSAYRRITAPAR